MSCAKTCGALFARSVLRTFHSPAGRPSNSDPTTKPFGRVPGRSASKFQVRIEDSAAADTLATANAVRITQQPANLACSGIVLSPWQLGRRLVFIFVTYIAILCNMNYTPCHYGMGGVFVLAAVQGVLEPAGRFVASIAAVRGDHAQGWGLCSS